MDPYAIYEDLKEKIIWLDILPNTTLQLTDLAETYKVSRNPITIALTRLDAEEWVVRNGSHFVTSPLTVERMRESTEIRLILEVQANIWAMNRITAEGLANLKSIWNEIKQIPETAGNKEIVRMDFRFHRAIYHETHNKQLAATCERLLCHYLRFWLSGPYTIQKDVFFKETLEIISSIEEKDEIRLRAASTAHIKASLDTILGLG